jgi:hypothetical protein
MTVVDTPESENSQLRIALHFPDGRELLWVTEDSPLNSWDVGQRVVFRSNDWVVLARTENEGDESITFRLGLAG